MQSNLDSQYKDKLTKGKALFEILLVVTLSFVISFSLAPQVEAQANSCCQEAVSGEICVEGLGTEQCAEGYTQTSCESVPSCGITGCCEVGERCSSETTAASCEASQGIFSPGVDCNQLDQCQESCCVIGNQCRLETSYQCDVRGGAYNSGIRDESACTSFCNQFNFGCCLDSCTYESGQGCEDFIEGVECSRTTECSEQCEAQDHTGCDPNSNDGHVYNFDSCGNREDIAERCDPLGITNHVTSCGDSDGDGQYTCESWDCSGIWDNPLVDENGDCSPTALEGDPCFTNDPSERRHGESWCQYQGSVGPGQDLPGSTHYKHYCWKGQEFVDKCNEDRSEFCAYGRGQSLLSGEVETFAECITNQASICADALTEDECNNGGSSCLWMQDQGTTRITQLESGDFNVSIFINYLYELCDEDDGTCTADEWDDKEGFVLPPKEGEEEGRFGDNDDICHDDGCDALFVCPSGDNDCEDENNLPSGSLRFPFCNIVLNPNADDPSSIIREDCHGNPASGIYMVREAPSEQPVRRFHTYVFSFVLPEGSYKMNINNLGADAAFGEDGDFNMPPVTLSREAIEAYSQEVGKCVPLVPPAGDQLCERGSLQGDNRLIEATVWKDGFFGIGSLECEGSCELYGQDFRLGSNALCNAYGDCGAKYNLAGEFTKDGFVRDCRLGNDYENIESECPVGSDDVEAEEIDFAPYKVASVGLEIFQIPQGMFDGYRQGASFGEEVLAGVVGGALVGALFAASGIGAAIGAVAGAIAGFFNFIGGLGQNTEKYDLGSICRTWEPPRGGDNCGLCHTPRSEGGLLPDGSFTSYLDEDFPAYECTESVCESLGALCQHENTIEGSKCIEVANDDTTAPRVELVDVIYECNDAGPGSVGNCNVNSNQRLQITGELKEFSAVNITLKTVDPARDNADEFARCGFTSEPGRMGFQDVDLFFEENGELSSTHSLNIPNVGEDEEYQFFVFCQDTSPQQNDQATWLPYVINFKSAPEPDLTPPEIVSFDPEEDAAFTRFDRTSLDVVVETNEDVPRNGGCRFSKAIDTPFEEMEGGMTCTPGGLRESPSCRGTILDLELDDTPVYFKCQDTDGNTMRQDRPLGGYYISRSGPLNITDIRCPHFENAFCDELIYDKNISFDFNTRGGAEGTGHSTCAYRVNNGNYITMFTTGESRHEQEGFTFGREGDYKIDLQCTDLAENVAEESFTLKHRVDSTAPAILNIFNIRNTLHLRTTEKAVCKFASNESNILDGELGTSTGFIHDVSEDTNLYKVRCEDRFFNAGTFLNVYLVNPE